MPPLTLSFSLGPLTPSLPSTEGKRRRSLAALVAPRKQSTHTRTRVVDFFRARSLSLSLSSPYPPKSLLIGAMGQQHVKEFLNPAEVNFPLLTLAGMSILFNSVEYGVFRWSNFFGNAFLILGVSFSTGFTSHLHRPVLGAQLGLASAAFFTFAPHLRIVNYNRFFPTWVRYGIGGFYMTYHGLALYNAKYGFEDAMEDEEGEKF